MLYHGTLNVHLDSLLAGIDLARARSSADFGRGFYTTMALEQAQSWAERRAEVSAATVEPVVVRFAVARHILASLDTLWFVRGNREAADYWAFVRHCRQETIGHRPDGAWYDLVVGPVTQNWLFRLMIADSDQVSFHTARAVAVLQAADWTVMRWPR